MSYFHPVLPVFLYLSSVDHQQSFTRQKWGQIDFSSHFGIEFSRNYFQPLIKEVQEMRKQLVEWQSNSWLFCDRWSWDAWESWNSWTMLWTNQLSIRINNCLTPTDCVFRSLQYGCTRNSLFFNVLQNVTIAHGVRTLRACHMGMVAETWAWFNINKPLGPLKCIPNFLTLNYALKMHTLMCKYV